MPASLDFPPSGAMSLFGTTDLDMRGRWVTLEARLFA
jgi:hypothetical protein